MIREYAHSHQRSAAFLERALIGAPPEVRAAIQRSRRKQGLPRLNIATPTTQLAEARVVAGEALVRLRAILRQMRR